MKRVGLYLLLILLSLYCLSPIIWQLITSFTPDAELTTIPPLLPIHPTTAHYVAIFKKRSFLRAILNSFIVATTTTLFSLSIGSLAAFALAKLQLKGKLFFLAFVLSVSIFPPISIVSPLYLLIRALGWRDTPLALILTYTTFSLPLSIWLLTNFFKQIPDELYIAARIDGCTPFQVFYKIFLPLSAPGLFATAILVFIFAWNEFLFALTFTSTSASRTIPVAIVLFPGLHEIPWGEIAAATIVVIIPLVILVLIFQRWIVEGLTAGAIKG